MGRDRLRCTGWAAAGRGRRAGLCCSRERTLSVDALQFSAVSLFSFFSTSQLSMLVLILPCPSAADDHVPIIFSLPAFVPFLVRQRAVILAFPQLSQDSGSGWCSWAMLQPRVLLEARVMKVTAHQPCPFPAAGTAGSSHWHRLQATCTQNNEDTWKWRYSTKFCLQNILSPPAPPRVPLKCTQGPPSPPLTDPVLSYHDSP